MVDEKTKSEVRHIFSLSRTEILYLFIIFMLGISIFFSGSIIQPLQKIADRTLKNQEYAIVALNLSMKQQDVILAKLNEIEDIVNGSSSPLTRIVNNTLIPT
jgi:hypothetical protein